MKRETPLTEATERALTRSRMISQADLLKGGAELIDDDQIVLTETQLDETKRMMKEELANKNYKDTAEINGIKIDIWWSDIHKGYMIAFGNDGVYENRLLIGQDERVARAIFDYAKRRAAEVENAKKLYELITGHINTDGKFDFNISDFYWHLTSIDSAKKNDTVRPQTTSPVEKDRKKRIRKKL